MRYSPAGVPAARSWPGSLGPANARWRYSIAGFLSYKVVNLAICALIVVLPLAYNGGESIRGHW
jgi:hypothetical protein